MQNFSKTFTTNREWRVKNWNILNLFLSVRFTFEMWKGRKRKHLTFVKIYIHIWMYIYTHKMGYLYLFYAYYDSHKCDAIKIRGEIFVCFVYDIFMFKSRSCAYVCVYNLNWCTRWCTSSYWCELNWLILCRQMGVTGQLFSSLEYVCVCVFPKHN